MSSPEYLFLYGSLMDGLGAMEVVSGHAYVRFVREAQVVGQLYDLGDYPGLVSGKGRVKGEVYEVLSPEIWSILDPFEDFFPSDRTGSLYLRKSVELVDGSGVVWVYIYNQKVDEQKLIPGGDWRTYWEEKSKIRKF